jgi:hypothetical protein
VSSDGSDVSKWDGESEGQELKEEPVDGDSTMVRPTTRPPTQPPVQPPPAPAPPQTTPPPTQQSPQPVRHGKPLDVSFWARLVILSLGGAAVVVGVVLAIFPAPRGHGLNSEHATTVTVGKSGTSTVTSDKTTRVAPPRSERSSTTIVAVLTAGIGLLLVAGFWSRLREFSLGNLTVALTDAVVLPGALAIADVNIGIYPPVDDTAVNMLIDAVNGIGALQQQAVRVDLKGGNLWRSLNLGFFVLLVATRTRAEVLVFTADAGPGRSEYIGAAAVSTLARRLVMAYPVLRKANERIGNTKAMGRSLAEELAEVAREAPIEPDPKLKQEDYVNVRRLDDLAGDTLERGSVSLGASGVLSAQEQREIISFPLTLVPATRDREFERVLDKTRLAERIAMAAAWA